MQRDHAFEERRLGARDVLNCLSWHGFRQEADEVAGMTGIEGNPNLTLRLEAADTGPVAGARINDDEWTFVRVDFDAFGRHDAYQHIVHWPRQLAAVHDELTAEFQHMRCGFCCMRSIAFAALVQHIEKEQSPLTRIDPIGPPLLDQIGTPSGKGRVRARCNRGMGCRRFTH